MLDVRSRLRNPINGVLRGWSVHGSEDVWVGLGVLMWLMHGQCVGMDVSH